MKIEMPKVLQGRDVSLNAPGKALPYIFIFILGVIVFNLLTFSVYRTEHAVVTRFGEAVRVVMHEVPEDVRSQIEKDSRFRQVKIVEGSGLFFKMPFIENVSYYENRLITYDTTPRDTITRDKKVIVLDNAAQWKIVNPLLFHITVKNERAANTRLDDIMYSNINEEVGRAEAQRVISDKDFALAMLGRITTSTNRSVSSFGIEVVDVLIKRPMVPEQNKQNIFNRMETERQRIAAQYRSEGDEEANKIESDARRQEMVISSEAYREAERIKGEGDAEAARIYAAAYSRDPEFFNFYRSLEAYRQTMQGQTKLVIPIDSEFARYLLGTR